MWKRSYNDSLPTRIYANKKIWEREIEREAYDCRNTCCIKKKNHKYENFKAFSYFVINIFIFLQLDLENFRENLVCVCVCVCVSKDILLENN